MSNEFTNLLDDGQKKLIEENWDKMDLKSLTQLVFNDKSLDGRCIQAKAVKAYLAEKNWQVKTTEYQHNKIGETELTQDQKDYIQNNYQKSSGPLEIGRILFNNTKLTVLNREIRAVIQYCKEIDPFYKKSDDPVDDVEYKVPASLYTLILKVNRYVPNARTEGKPTYDKDQLTAQDEKNLKSLLSYLNIPRFKIEADKYIKKVDRELFESTFIAFCFDKSDLQAEEVHQYISLSSEIVLTYQVDKTVQKLDQRFQDKLNDDSQKFFQAEVDAMKSVMDKLDKSKERQKKLIGELVTSRSDRMKSRIQSNSSLHSLVEMWKKEVDRQKIIMMNEKRQKTQLKEEVVRLSTMDSLKAEIFGLDKDDIVK